MFRFFHISNQNDLWHVCAISMALLFLKGDTYAARAASSAASASTSALAAASSAAASLAALAAAAAACAVAVAASVEMVRRTWRTSKGLVRGEDSASDELSSARVRKVEEGLLQVLLR